MREDLEWEAAEQEGLQQLYGEIALQAVNEFSSERLRSYYVANTEIARPAHDALSLAQALESQFPRAAVVFAATAIEVTIKSVLLKPLVYGLVHNDTLAGFIAGLSIERNRNLDHFKELLGGVFREFAGIEIDTYKRVGSARPIVQEADQIRNARNQIVHLAATDRDDLAPLAIKVAATFLNVLFPKLLTGLNLRTDASSSVLAQQPTGQ